MGKQDRIPSAIGFGVTTLSGVVGMLDINVAWWNVGLVVIGLSGLAWVWHQTILNALSFAMLRVPFFRHSFGGWAIWQQHGPHTNEAIGPASKGLNKYDKGMQAWFSLACYIKSKRYKSGFDFSDANFVFTQKINGETKSYSFEITDKRKKMIFGPQKDTSPEYYEMSVNLLATGSEAGFNPDLGGTATLTGVSRFIDADRHYTSVIKPIRIKFDPKVR